MCRRRFVFEQCPIAFPCALGHPDKCELISAIGCLLLLRSTRLPARKKLRDQANACRCKGCPWQIAGYPSNDDSPKQKTATPVERQNAKSTQNRICCVASAARACDFDSSGSERA